MSFTNETALITGATSGISYELAKLFAADKVNLVIVSRNEYRLHQVAAEFRQLGSPRVNVILKDLSVPGAARQLHDRTKEDSINVTTLVNDGGFGEFAYFREDETDIDDSIMQLNMVSTVQLTKLYLIDMLRAGKGRILNLASIASSHPPPVSSLFAACKAFILSFSEAVVSEIRNTEILLTVLTGSDDNDLINNVRAFKNNQKDLAEVAKEGYDGLQKGMPYVTSRFPVQAQLSITQDIPYEALAPTINYMKE
ncbi:MAG TPA: SDR family NAD(P)-dependent oxidoreductase [Bacteroidales bacterium]|nr:SDR family NAD(P)-dependent oxidoreductase [Bacteroidales bacterium]